MERYFVLVDDNGDTYALLRLVNSPPVFAEEIWKDGAWQETDILVKYLVYGEVDLEEVSLDEAKPLMTPANPDTTKHLGPVQRLEN
jgi:hypothetical protein